MYGDRYSGWLIARNNLGDAHFVGTIHINIPEKLEVWGDNFEGHTLGCECTNPNLRV